MSGSWIDRCMPRGAIARACRDLDHSTESSSYQSAPSQEEWDEDPEAAQEKYDKYFEQPVEVDAREEGAEFVEGMTPEELDRLLEESQ